MLAKLIDSADLCKFSLPRLKFAHGQLVFLLKRLQTVLITNRLGFIRLDLFHVMEADLVLDNKAIKEHVSLHTLESGLQRLTIEVSEAERVLNSGRKTDYVKGVDLFYKDELCGNLTLGCFLNSNSEESDELRLLLVEVEQAIRVADTNSRIAIQYGNDYMWQGESKFDYSLAQVCEQYAQLNMPLLLSGNNLKHQLRFVMTLLALSGTGQDKLYNYDCELDKHELVLFLNEGVYQSSGVLFLSNIGRSDKDVFNLLTRLLGRSEVARSKLRIVASLADREHRISPADLQWLEYRFVRLPILLNCESTQILMPPRTEIPIQSPLNYAKEHPALEKAVRYLGENYKVDLSMVELAQKCFVSSSHLSFLFKSRLGKTFKQLLTEIRIEKAKELFQTMPARQITQICSDVGFIDLSHFEKTFKKHVGLSPSRYRAQFRTPLSTMR